MYTISLTRAARCGGVQSLSRNRIPAREVRHA